MNKFIPVILCHESHMFYLRIAGNFFIGIDKPPEKSHIDNMCKYFGFDVITKEELEKLKESIDET